MSDIAAQQGTMIVVVGPSGAGKDSLMDYARRQLANDPRIGFVRRTITRDADAGSEDHHAVSAAMFKTLRDEGKFAVSWDAHGLSYGIPLEAAQDIQAGKTLVANGSRAALGEFEAAFADTLVVVITAAPEVIAHRLAQRGREDEEEIRRRIARSSNEWPITCRHLVIDNSGPLEVAGEELVSAIVNPRRLKAAV